MFIQIISVFQNNINLFIRIYLENSKFLFFLSEIFIHFRIPKKYEFEFKSNCEKYIIQFSLYSSSDIRYHMSEVIDHHLKYITLYFHINDSYGISIHKGIFSSRIKDYLKLWNYEKNIYISDLKLQNLSEYKCVKRNEKIEQLLKNI
jgi:hypothetical protein